MQVHIRWTVSPVIENVAVVNGGIDAFFKANGFSHRDSLRLQACVEGVFGYCVGNIKARGFMEDVTMELGWEERDVIIRMSHNGPGGEWDNVLSKDIDKDAPIRRTSFDSMGLFIARELLHSLTYQGQFDHSVGRPVRLYELVYRMDPGE